MKTLSAHAAAAFAIAIVLGSASHLAGQVGLQIVIVHEEQVRQAPEIPVGACVVMV